MSFNALIDAARYSLCKSIELFLPTKFIGLAGILTFILLNLTYKVRKIKPMLFTIIVTSIRILLAI